MFATAPLPSFRATPQRLRTAGLAALLLLMIAWLVHARWLRAAEADRPLPGAVADVAPCKIWFVGSSSFAYWDRMAADMQPWRAVNRGVAGADLPYLIHRLGREAMAARPAAILLYAGENDIDLGHPLPDVIRDYDRMIRLLSEDMPDVPIIAMAIKPTPARWQQRPQQLRLNGYFQTLSKTYRTVSYLDANTRLMNGQQFGPYYFDDGVHLNEAGHKIWAGGIDESLSRVAPGERGRCGVAAGGAAGG